MNNGDNKNIYFTSWDNTELFYRAWNIESKSEKAIIYLHRGHEHSGRISGIVNAINLSDFNSFAYDCRGHGNSPGPRGYAENFATLVKDLDCFVRFISEEYDIAYKNIIVIANSVGAVVASTWLHDYAPEIRGAVLVAPAFEIKLYVPFAIPMLRLLMRIKPKAVIKSYVKAKLLTHDTDEIIKYNNDSLITREISVNILLGLHDTSKRIIEDAAAIVTPTLVLSAGSDFVVKNNVQKKFFDGLSSKLKKHVSLSGFYHAILYEKQKDRAVNEIKNFIEEAFQTTQEKTFLLKSDTVGFTKDEYDKLSSKPNMLKRINYGFQRISLRTICLLSDGINIGFQHGFDSGKSLDYVYRNKPHGKTTLGYLIDSIYLNSTGWVGIRKRKRNLKAMINNAIEKLKSQNKNIQILDIASGPGRYILEIIKEHEHGNISAALQDYKKENVTAARELAEKMNLKNVTVQLKDAFNKNELAVTTPEPNIAVVSGLYELIPDNIMIIDSLSGLHKCMQTGSYLIYTGQPWHPQLEMIARTLPNREGRPWIMRRRTQAELDELVRSAGFRKIKTEIDDQGIFTVSLAIKD